MKSLKSYDFYHNHNPKFISCPFCDKYIYGRNNVCDHGLVNGLLAYKDYYELQIQQLKHELEYQAFQMAVMKQDFEFEKDK